MTKHYNLLYYPHPKLLQRCEPVNNLTDEDRQVIERMKEICIENDGYALAANQIGYLKRIVVFAPNSRNNNEWVVMIDPVWASRSPRSVPTGIKEGCLSFPSVFQETVRYEFINVHYTNMEGKLVEEIYNGLMAIAVQHECEHLDGKTFIDGLSKLKQTRIKDKIKKVLR